MNERLIITGLIVSTEFCKRIKHHWSPGLLSSSTAEELSRWCWTYFDEYKQAPGREIETLYFKRLAEGTLDKDVAEEMEEELLPGLSEEYENNGLNVELLLQETINHLNGRRMVILSEKIADIVDNGKGDYAQRLQQAEQLLTAHKTAPNAKDDSLDLAGETIEESVRKAFQKASDPVVRLPKQIGELMNEHLVPGGFVSFLAPEKRGKTWILLQLGMTACVQNKNVAMFQAGDMNEAEQLRRISSYLCKRPTKEKYAKEHYEPVRDCIYNQRDDCSRKERECDFGVFSDLTVNQVLNLDYDEILQAAKDNEDYSPCWNCSRYRKEKCGVPWLQKVPEMEPLTEDEAVAAFTKFFKKNKRKFKLSTHANGTLSVKNIETILDKWEIEEQFIPDIILIDYADLLVPSNGTEFRHQQNSIWKDLRRLSQTKRGEILPLVISPTQADAAAYKEHRLKLSNFSEDKRKYAHVTAMWGLNQDPKGKDKKLGILRINELIIREGEFSQTNECSVLMNLRRGRPIIGSYFAATENKE